MIALETSFEIAVIQIHLMMGAAMRTVMAHTGVWVGTGQGSL